jgi:type I restriction enzyme S subunit
MELKAGYKQTEIGVFSEEWEVAPIRTVAAVEGGYAFSSKKFVSRGKYQVVKMSNLYAGKLDLERSASYLNEIDEQEKHYLLRENDILITLTGTTGKRDYGYSHRITDEQHLLLNQRVGRLIVGENADPSYVAFQIKTPSFLDQFFNVSKGGTGNQTNVGTGDVAAMRLPLAPLPEQRAIAGALGDVDALLGGLTKLIAKKRDLKQAAMQQLLTGHQRLPGFTDEWETLSFGNVFSRVNAKENQIQTSEYQTTGAFPVVDQGKEPVVGFSDREDKRFGCPEGGVIVFGDHTCIVKFVQFDFVVGADGTQILATKTGHCARFHAFQLQLREIPTTGYNRHFKFLKERLFDAPSLSEQTAIAAVLSDMDAELAALEQRRDKTRAIKQGMMQELLTGRIRLV